MKFGFTLPNILSPISYATAIKTSAQIAEAVGFDSIWASDHILMPDEFPQYGKGTESITTLAYLSGITQSIVLGISVLVLPLRNPLIAAKELASLAHLSGRELIVGVGVGWNKTEYGYLNADFKHRGKLTDEYLRIMQHLWTQPRAPYDGTYRFAGATFSPHLETPPRIWVGGESEAALKRVAEFGTGFHPNWKLGDLSYGEKVRRIRELAPDKPISMSLRANVDMGDGAAKIIDQISQLAEVGLDYPVVGFKHETLGDLVDAIEQFGRDVIPALRG